MPGEGVAVETADMKYKLIRSNRKSIGIQIKEDLSVTVRAPYGVSEREIERILKEKEAWILKSLGKMRKENEARHGRKDATPIDYLSSAELKDLKKRAAVYIPARVAHFATLMGVDYGRIAIRCQKTRWGSCSSKGNLNFNLLLMLTPEEVIDYVVVHELCHRLEMNHSKAFWREVENVLPDYRTRLLWLKREGGKIMRKVERE